MKQIVENAKLLGAFIMKHLPKTKEGQMALLATLVVAVWFVMYGRKEESQNDI